MAENNKSYSEYTRTTERGLKVRDIKGQSNTLVQETTTISNQLDLIEENLIFDYKPVSPLKLFYNISGKKEIILMIFATLLSIGAGCSNALKPKLLGDAINSLASTQLTNKTDDEYEDIMDNIEPKINQTIKEFLIYGSFLFVFNFLSLFLWLYSSLRQMHNLKIDYFSLILKQEQGWFDQNNTFEFASKVQAQLEGIELGLGDRFGTIILKVIEIISGYVIGFQTSWKLTLVLSACSVPFIIAGHFLMRYGTEKEKIWSIKSREKSGGIAEEILNNIKTISSFANFDYEIKRFNKPFENTKNKPKKLNSGLVQGVVNLGIYFGFTITCIYARKLVESDYDHHTVHSLFTAGDVVKVLVAVRKSILSMGEIPTNVLIIKESCASSSDYFTLKERIPENYDSKGNLKPNKEQIKGKIEFKNIKFAYPDDKEKKYVLDDLNIVVQEGKKVALVGESGCGKSTTVNLIERLYDPNEGEILLDGINIKEYNIEYLRSLIGYVKQEPVLFNKSIRKNIIFGREEKLKELGDIDTLLSETCAEAYIKEFIEKQPEKYDYQVGFKGNKLLPGQKQRISIARALLLKPKILILDEATSSLDHMAEEKVQMALDIINKKKITTIIIGNRLNIIKNADMIYALKKGKVIEKGTHIQLMAKKGYYAKIIKTEIKKRIIGKNKNKKKIQKKGKGKGKLKVNYNNLINQTIKYELKQKDEIDIDFKISKIIELIQDKKCALFIGILTGLLYGAIIPSTSLILGKLTTAFTLPDNDKMQKNVLKWSLILLLISFIGAFCNYFKTLNLSSISSSVISKIRKKLFRKYLELHMGFFDFDCNNPNGLLSILSVEIYYFKYLFISILGAMEAIIGIIITSLVIGFYYDWHLTLILFCFFPLKILFSFFSGRFKVGGQRKYKKISIEANNYFSECVTNTKTIFSFNFQDGAVNMYKSILDKETKDYIKDSLIFSAFVGGGEFLSYASNSVAYKSGINFIRHKSLTFATMINVKKTLMSYIEGSDISIKGLSEFSKVKMAYKFIFNILDTPSKINPFEDANKDKISPINIKGKIEFKNVTFSYPTKPDIQVLKNVSFIIQPWSRAAIVGNSESGKSTIIQLIERFYDINNGEILIDDVNIKDYNLYELRKKIGLISEEPILFKRGLYENILYGNLEANRNDVFYAADKADLTDFLYNKEFHISEKSSSQGEKQKISIARVFLKNPVILLLDNVTSSLDQNSEKEIKKKIREIQKGRTSISITHRLSNIINYDIIFFMDNGQLVEYGTHNQLIEKKGYYYNLYDISQK